MLRAVVLSALSSLALHPVQAAEWDISKGVDVSVDEIYSDNADHVSSGGKSQFFTRVGVTPNIALQGKGARASVDLTGALNYQLGSGSARRFNPRLNGRANAELVRDYLFVDATASVRQNVIDPFGDITLDRLNDTSNTTISYQYSLSPYYRMTIRDVGDLILRYSYTNTSHSENNASDSGKSQFTVDLNANQGSTHSKFTWGINTDLSSSSNSGSSTNDQRSVSVIWGYQFNRRWQLNGSLGREWNDFQSTRSSTNGVIWTLNTRWTPNPRTSLTIGYGGRFLGSTPTLDFSYRSRRSTLKLGYSKVVTDANSELASLAIDPVTGNLFPVAVLNNDVFVDERFTGSYALKGRRTTLTLSASLSQQSNESTTQDSELTKLGLSLSRNMSGNVSANASLNWYQQDRTSNDSAETWQANIGLRVKIGQRTTMNVGYIYNKRDGDQATANYEENRATLGLNLSL